MIRNAPQAAFLILELSYKFERQTIVDHLKAEFQLPPPTGSARRRVIDSGGDMP